MTQHNTFLQPPKRKPRIALMGEFSAGKSTLANVLMGQSLSPTRITATQVPPLWYTHGEGAPIRIDGQGQEAPVDEAGMKDVTISNTIAIRLFSNADILEMCDIIDMPGSSDPNITVNTWQSMLPFADAVIWCTPATQAWRQSEAALWEEVGEDMGPFSMLLVTRIDKILNDQDRDRLLARVDREAGHDFRCIRPVSLIAAQGAGEDLALWQDSGMEAVLDELSSILVELEPVVANTPAKAVKPLTALGGADAEAAPEEVDPAPAPEAVPEAAPDRSAGGDAAAEPVQPDQVSVAMPRATVVPKRVKVGAIRGTRRARPSRDTSSESLI